MVLGRKVAASGVARTSVAARASIVEDAEPTQHKISLTAPTDRLVAWFKDRNAFKKGDESVKAKVRFLISPFLLQ